MSSSPPREPHASGRDQADPQERQGSSSGGAESSGQSPHSPGSPRRSAGTTLGFSGASPVAGRPSLVMEIPLKDGKHQVVDLWNEVMNLSPDRMERVLNLAQADNQYELVSFIRAIEYQGFDRLFYITHALSKMSVSVFCRFAILGAVRGSQFEKIREKCESMPADLVSNFTSCGFVKTPKKKTDLTILRCTASIPHWCAYWMSVARVPKKLDVDCDAALQFPGAASLPMSKEVRIQHVKFCIAFSSVLPGGSFNTNIYMTATNNSIPIKDIHPNVLRILCVSSSSESHKLTSEEMSEQTQALVKK